MKIEALKKKIKPLNAAAMIQCKARWDAIAKPLHGLGKMEDVVMQIAGITRTAEVRIEKKALLVMCADNGVTKEGVTQTGSEVTAIVAENFLAGKTTASIMAKRAGADVFPIDIGICGDTRLVNEKIARGTKNIAVEPAMSRTQALAAVAVGVSQVERLKAQGYEIIATGEMGIGNTTTSSAMAAVFLNQDPVMVTGTGAGLSGAGLEKKIQVIKTALEKHQPDPENPLDVLAKVGGFDLAGLTGVFLGAAVYRLPVVIDGLISAVAALTASKLDPLVRSYAIPSHISAEPASAKIMEALGMSAPLHLGMNLGEGTGALTLLPLLDMACDVYKQMGTFTDYQIEPYQPKGCG